MANDEDLTCEICEPWYPRLCQYCDDILHCHSQEDEWGRVTINKFCQCYDEHGNRLLGGEW